MARISSPGFCFSSRAGSAKRAGHGLALLLGLVSRIGRAGHLRRQRSGQRESREHAEILIMRSPWAAPGALPA